MELVIISVWMPKSFFPLKLWATASGIPPIPSWMVSPSCTREAHICADGRLRRSRPGPWKHGRRGWIRSAGNPPGRYAALVSPNTTGRLGIDFQNNDVPPAPERSAPQCAPAAGESSRAGPWVWRRSRKCAPDFPPPSAGADCADRPKIAAQAGLLSASGRGAVKRRDHIHHAPEDRVTEVFVPPQGQAGKHRNIFDPPF